MPTKIQRWGNSLAVRLPKELIRRLALKEGSRVLMRERLERIIIEPMRTQKTQSRDMWKSLLIPTDRKKENVSERVDEILYDADKAR